MRYNPLLIQNTHILQNKSPYSVDYVEIWLKEIPYVDTFHAVHCTKNEGFFIKGFLSKCDQIRRKLRIWSHLLRRSLMENFIFFTVMREYIDQIKSHILQNLRSICFAT